jgi:hypothetical protein
MPIKTKPLTNEELITVWQKAVDTQMHFNEMSVKSRQLGLTFVAASLGLAVVLLSQGKAFNIDFWGWHVHVALLLVLAASLSMMAVRMLDLNVYHKMLRGAVTFGEDLEQAHLLKILGLNKGMTQSISHFSRYSDAKAVVENGVYAYSGHDKVSALDKLKKFYNIVIAVLVGVAVALFVVTNWLPSMGGGH